MYFMFEINKKCYFSNVSREDAKFPIFFVDQIENYSLKSIRSWTKNWPATV